MKTNRFFFVFLSFIILVSTFTSPVMAKKNIMVTLNGKPISFDQPPIMQNNRVLVPMRAIFEALGAYIHWVDDIQVILAFKGQSVIIMRIDEKELFVTDVSEFETLDDLTMGIYETAYGDADGSFLQTNELDIVPQIIRGRTLIPLRAVSEALGVSVDWDSENSVVKLSCSEDFIYMTNKEQSFIDGVIYLYDVALSETYTSHQGGYIDLESDYVLKPNLDLKFNYKTIAGGGSDGLAIKSDRTLWAWGSIPDEIDNITIADRSIPSKIMDDIILLQ